MAARACDEKKAKEIRLININKVSYISDWILIAEGLSDVQVRSITNSVESELRANANMEPIRKSNGYTKEGKKKYLRFFIIKKIKSTKEVEVEVN